MTFRDRVSLAVNTLSSKMKENAIDNQTVERLDRQHEHARKIGGANAMAELQTSTEIVEDWADTNSVLKATNGQVSGNKFYATNNTAPGGFTKAISVPATGRWRLQTLYYHKAGGSGSAYFGVDAATAGTAIVAGQTNAMTIGMTTGNARSGIIGSAITGAGVTANTGVTLGSNPTVDTTYLITIEADDVFLTFNMKAVGVIGDFYHYRVRRDQLASGGKVINNIHCYLVDSRGTSGHAYGPFILQTGSLQSARNRVVGGQVIEGADFRLRITAKDTSFATPYMYSLPKNYDPRRPHPVVMWMHQSITGSGWDNWEETRVHPVTQALTDAGYIICGVTNADQYGNETSQDQYLDAYKHLRNTFNTGPLFLVGVSMGTLDVANAVQRREWPTPAAAVGIGGAYDLDWVVSLGGGYPAAVYAAYGGSAGTYATQKIGYDPIDIHPKKYRGIPWRLYTSSSDTLQPPAQPEAFKNLVAPYAAEATTVYGTGDHLDPSQYQPSNILSFFASYLDVPTPLPIPGTVTEPVFPFTVLANAELVPIGTPASTVIVRKV